MEPLLRKDCLAFYDSSAGLVPCKVNQIDGTSGVASTAQRVTVTLTATRGGYMTGERITTSGLHVVPRLAVTYSNGVAKIKSYTVEAS